MSPKKAFHRLHDMVAQDLAAIAPNTILPEGRGYLAFEIYSIQPKQGSWSVGKYGIPVADMTSARTAISWCVADKYGQHHLSTDILILDQQKMLLENDIRIRETMASNKRLAISTDAIEAKISTRKRRLQQVDQRLTKCVNVAKYWQLRGFNNETSRSGRAASHRTHR